MEVQVEWNRELRIATVNEVESVIDLKKQLQAMFDVPWDRMRIVVIGSVMNNSSPLTEYNLELYKPGSPDVLKVFGCRADELIYIESWEGEAPPTEKMIKTPTVVTPPGIFNVGNTCYLGSVIQILNRTNLLLPLLKKTEFKSGVNNALTTTLKTMESTYNTLDPSDLWLSLKIANPIFAERDPAGGWRQQDAEEALSYLLTTLESEIPQIKDLFGITTVSSSGKVETSRSLLALCGDQSFGVSYLTQGIALGLAESESVSKTNDIKTDEDKLTDSKESVVTNNENQKEQTEISKPMSLSTVDVPVSSAIQAPIKTNEITMAMLMESATKRKITGSLPKYLVVQLCRFEWKKGNAFMKEDAGRTKIVRQIDIPQTLDVFDWCSTELQEYLLSGREISQFMHEPNTPVSFIKKKQLADPKTDFVTLQTGRYRLIGAVAHAGRTPESGHYVAHVSHLNNSPPVDSEQWFHCDDTSVHFSCFRQTPLHGKTAKGFSAYIVVYERTDVVVE